MSFKEGMKLEAIDPLSLASICVATVKKVRQMHTTCWCTDLNTKCSICVKCVFSVSLITLCTNFNQGCIQLTWIFRGYTGAKGGCFPFINLAFFFNTVSKITCLIFVTNRISWYVKSKILLAKKDIVTHFIISQYFVYKLGTLYPYLGGGVLLSN